MSSFIGTQIADSIIGSAGNDTISGFGGDDTINGGLGKDRVSGGRGNDIYFFETLGDVAVEIFAEGEADEVRSYVTLKAIPNIEIYRLLGSQDLQITGGALNDQLIGNVGDNTLSGGLGADILTGGGGADLFVLAAGKDVDIITDFEHDDSISVAKFKFSEIVSDSGTTLLAGKVAVESRVDGTLIHFGLDGKAGADLTVKLNQTGLSAESFVISPSGTKVSMGALPNDATHDKDEIAGSSGDDVLRGLGGADTLIGDAGNDTLIGGASADCLVGGSGNDVYVIDTAKDKIIELADEGTNDRVESWVNYKAGKFIEDITLLGLQNITAFGNTFDNVIIGNSGNNTLTGSGGNDTLTGGQGNDVFQIATKNGVDQITDFGTGSDTIRVAGAKLNGVIRTGNGENVRLGEIELETFAPAGPTTAITRIHFGLNATAGAELTVVVNGALNVDQLASVGTDLVRGTSASLLGTSSTDLIVGGSIEDTLRGGDGNDKLFGLGGSDLLDGGRGNDTLVGGSGGDIYRVDSRGDKIIELSSDTGDDIIESVVTSTLKAFLNVEGLRLIGSENAVATGSDQDNILFGNVGNNTLSGGKGNDELTGGQGDDVFLFDATNNGVDVIVDREIQDVIRVNKLGLVKVEAGNGSGLGKGEVHYDNTGRDLIVRIGSDTKAGFDIEITVQADGNLPSNNDAYKVVLDGTDLAFVPDATDPTNPPLYGTIVLGTNAADSLTAGSSRVFFHGLGGNDTYVGSAQGDSLYGGSGADTLDGSGGEDSIFGGAGNDKLTGGAGNDFLDGGVGSDSLIGGDGDDSYRITDKGDKVIELASGGQDTVNATFSYTLVAEVEHLVLVGDFASNLNGTGNALDNNIRGTAGNNLINGMAGNDTLLGSGGADTITGGLGNDRLSGNIDGAVVDDGASDVFLFAASNNGEDTITDLQIGDIIRIAGAKFTGDAITGGEGSLAQWAVAVERVVGSNKSLLHVGTDKITSGDNDAEVTIVLIGQFNALDFGLVGSDIILLS